MLEELKHNPAQLARARRAIRSPDGRGLAVGPEKHLVDVTRVDALLLRARGAWYGALDLGKWRFAFRSASPTRRQLHAGRRVLQSERGRGDARERDARCSSSGACPTIIIPADCADPAASTS
jgi:hypothetical protein